MTLTKPGAVPCYHQLPPAGTIIKILSLILQLPHTQEASVSCEEIIVRLLILVSCAQLLASHLVYRLKRNKSIKSQQHERAGVAEAG